MQFAVVGFTVADGRIVEIDLVADPDKLRRARLEAVRAREGSAGQASTEGCR